MSPAREPKEICVDNSYQYGENKYGKIEEVTMTVSFIDLTGVYVDRHVRNEEEKELLI